MPKKTDAATPAPLAVIGIGGCFPDARTMREYWANIKAKRDAIREVPASHWTKDDYFDADPKSPDKVYAAKGGFLQAYDFDPSEFGLAPNTLEATDPAQLFGLVAAKMALADAGYPVDQEWDRSRVSTILGVTGTLEIVVPLGARLGHPRWRKAMAEAGIPKDAAEDAVARIADSYVSWQESSFPGLLGNVVAGRIANRFNLGGTNCVVDAACGSSLSAAHMAVLELQAGRADMVITGGVDTFNDIFMYMCFTKTPALSKSGHAKPFDAKADGTTLGEGVGLVVLKRLADAQAHGDRIYAVLRGIGSSSDGRGKSIYAPSADGQVRALTEAYRVSGVDPATVELVEAHGTGTAVGDGIEVEALSAVYRKSGREGTWCALGSVKSMVGHTKAAAGSAALIKASLSLRHKVFPPTLKVTEPLPILAKGDSPFYLSLEKRPWMSPEGHPRRAACSALGFGGTNFHAVLEEHDARKTEIDWDADVEIVAVSGNDANELASKLKPFESLKSWDELRFAAAKSRADFNAQSQCRIAVVVEKSTDLAPLIAKAVSSLSANTGKAQWSLPEGVFYGSGKPGKLGVLFPGQGAQYTGMGRDLFCAFPQAFSVLESADAAFEGERRLSGFMFPRPGWTDAQKKTAEADLRATQVAQPALGAAALGALRVLELFGVKADAYAGHSYGELVALHAAGRYDEETLHRLSGLRGRLMAAGGGDLGSMLAVMAPAAEVEKAVKDAGLDLVLANKNAPEQNVLSGATAEIEKAQAVLAERGFKVVRLPVAAAFHSPLVAGALEPFAKALKKVPFAKPSVPVYANTTGEPYPAEAAASRDLLAGQLAKPVEFVKLVSAMRRDGMTTFLEVGAGARLSGLAKLILGDDSSIPVDASNGRKNGVADLARALARLAALGFAPDLTPWQGGEAGLKDARRTPRMAVTLTGAPYRSSKPKPRPVRPPLSATPAPSAPAAPGAAAPRVVASNDPVMGQALAAAQAGIDALARLQEETARLHLQFLKGQELAQRSVQALIEHQQGLVRLTGGAPAAMPSYTPAPMPAVAAPAPVVAAPAPAPKIAAPKTDVSGVLVSIISEKTGYPAETIDPSMDLEADLGIDSIKRVEILSAVSEKLPGAPKIKPEHLGTLRTLKSIADYLSEGMAAVPAAATAPVAATASSTPVLPTLVAIVSEKTGYPAETIDPSMDLEADLGIDSIKRVEILSAVAEKLPGAPKIKPEHLGTLRTLKSIADYMSEGMVMTSGASRLAPEQVAMSGKSSAVQTVQVLPVLVAIVSEKTGYPAETIDPSMDLEADLGIDSIKRVEILSAVSETLPDAPKIKPEHLGTLRTLQSIADYMSEGMVMSSQSSQLTPEQVAMSGKSSGEPTARVLPTLVAIVSDKTGYPAETIDPSMDLEADLGIDSIKRVEILSAVAEKLPGAPKIKPEHLGTLRTLASIADYLSAGTSAAPAAAPKAEPVAETPKAPEEPGVISRLAPELVPVGARDAFAFDKTLTVAIAKDSGLDAALARELRAKGLKAEVVALDDLKSLPAALGGAVVIAPAKPAGERCPWSAESEAWLKSAFLFVQEAGRRMNAAGTRGLVAGVTRLDGALGFEGRGGDPAYGGLAGLIKTAAREWPGLVCRAVDLDPALPVESAGQLLARELGHDGPVETALNESGVRTVAPVEKPIAAGGKDPLQAGDAVIVTGGARGVTAACALELAKAFKARLVLAGRSPAPEPEPAELAAAKTEADLRRLIAGREKGLAPKRVGEKARAVLAAREIRATLDALAAAGADARYRSVDVRDEAAVRALVAETVRDLGPVRGLVHGAGVLADKAIADKTPAMVDAVLDTKLTGLRRLLEALDPRELRLVALFSSSTARYGRVGQSDYAVANEVLNKAARALAKSRPACRVVAVGWGPWDGGMVDASLKALFAAEGVGVIGLREGARRLVAEARDAGGPSETVAVAALPGAKTALPVVFERDLSLETHPVLASHRLGGRAVVPLALSAEWLAHAALHAHPGMAFAGLDGLRATRALAVPDGRTTAVSVHAGAAERRDDGLSVPAEIRDASGALCASARVLLAARRPSAPAASAAPKGAADPKGLDAAYRDELFHGPDLRVLRAVTACGPDGIAADAKAAPAPSAWMRRPPRDRWLADPAALDAAFQAAILWTTRTMGAPCLPSHAARYRQYAEFPEGGARVALRGTRRGDGLAAADIEFLDERGGVVARLEGFEATVDPALTAAFGLGARTEETR
jgi:acyl transferase domain-containing protein/acyl carrier protein/NADP-dependent 3-hydroxy acid dehydrogenase YdfG